MELRTHGGWPGSKELVHNAKGDTGQGGGWPSSQEAGRSEAKAGQGLMTLITTEKIHSAQGSPQTNLGSAQIREGRLQEQGQHTTYPEKPGSLARLLENKRPSEQRGNVSGKSIEDKPAPRRPDHCAGTHEEAQLRSSEPGSSQKNYLVDSKNYE